MYQSGLAVLRLATGLALLGSSSGFLAPTPRHHAARRPSVTVQKGMSADGEFPEPEYIRSTYQGSDKLKGKVCIVTGGDSGIGRAVAIHFAREGAAAVTLVYIEEGENAAEAKAAVEAEGAKVLGLEGDVGDDAFCREVVERTVQEFKGLDVLVNNAGIQKTCDDIRDISKDQLEKTFRVNIFSHFYMTQAALDHMKGGASIISSTSVNTYMGAPTLVDYTATKGAIVGFIRSLSQQLISKTIRVNGVAPGPIWTPLIPATMPKETVEQFGQDFPMERPGQCSEVAPAYVFLASEDASYITGQVLHPNGGKVING